MRSKFTVSCNFFESCANKLVLYLFETLPVAKRSNAESIFPIGVNFRKGSKIETMLSKIKFGNFDIFVVNLMNFNPLPPHCVLNMNISLFKRSGYWKFYASKTFVVSTKIGISLSNNVLYLFHGFFGVLRPIPKKCSYLLKIAIGENRVSLLSFKTIFCKELAQKLNEKLPRKKLETSQFFNIWVILK